MSEEQVLERLMLMEQWKDSGDICTREELEAIGILIDLYKKKSKMINLMAEQLTTPVHNKEWVIEYFEERRK